MYLNINWTEYNQKQNVKEKLTVEFPWDTYGHFWGFISGLFSHPKDCLKICEIWQRAGQYINKARGPIQDILRN